MSRRFSAAMLVLLVFLSAYPAAYRASASGPSSIQRTLYEMPLYFIENQGQLDERASFYIQGHDKTIYFSPDGVTFALTAPRPASLSRRDYSPGLKATRIGVSGKPSIQRWAVRLDFVGANPGVQPVGESPAQAVISYFTGQPDQWQAGVRTYTRIRYPDLWPGIDLVYSGHANELKYEFVVQPGADPAQVQLAYLGASQVALTGDGQLEVSTPLGGFRDAAPVAYQVRNGQRLPVEMAYSLQPPERRDGRSLFHYSFDLGQYDPSLPLVLDPAVLVYAGFIDGTQPNSAPRIAVDNSGNAYIVGSAWNDEDGFPAVVGPDLTSNGDQDAFVAKLNASGTALIYAGFIGGEDYDQGSDVAIDGAGNAYITGSTRSDQASFPVKVGPDLTFNDDGQYPYEDAFVAKVSADGTSLVYAGYIGGASGDEGNGIAVDSSGNAYISGNTNSTESSFPVLIGPDLTHNSTTDPQGWDAFVAKVNAAGSKLLYAGYIGGASYDRGKGIAVDEDGNAYVTGSTNSDENSFPVIVGPDLTYNDGGGPGDQDVYVAKVSPTGAALLYAGYIGGAGQDMGVGIAVNEAGEAYISGNTSSSEGTFPVLVGPDLTYNGNWDVFVAKVGSTGDGLVYAGYVGGSGDEGFDDAQVAIDQNGNAYLLGSTESDQSSFPVLEGPDLIHNGGEDVFVAMVEPDGSGLVYAGYIGGKDQERTGGIAVDSAGNVYITGLTASTESTFPERVGPDLTRQDESAQAFVAKVGPPGAGPVDLRVGRIELIQGITMSKGYRVHVAERPAILRVFVDLEGAALVNNVTARLTRYVNGAAQDSLQAGPIALEFDYFEGDLPLTLNFSLPVAWLATGTGYVLQLDPGNAISESDEANNRYPLAGSQSFNFVDTPVLDVVIVPVTYARPGAPVTNPQVDDLSYLTWKPSQVYPVSRINYTVRSTPYTFTGDLRTDDGWSQLLDEITAVHEVEDPGQDKIYYGLVDFVTADGCTSLCTAGLGWLNTPYTPLLKTAVGLSSYPAEPEEVSNTLAHEVGHIYGRKHAPCYEGLVIDFYGDPYYPYEDGRIGQYGYNPSSGQLISPTTSDFMGYCSSSWTSDYTYYGIYQAFSWVEGWEVVLDLPYRTHLPLQIRGGGDASLAERFSSRSLVLSGFIAADGSLQVRPLFRSRRTPTPARDDSRYQAVLLDASGRVLASTPLELTQFAIDRLDSGELASGFRAALPLVEGVDRIQIFADGVLVFERSAKGAAPDLGTLVQAQNAQGATQLSWSPGKGTGELAYQVLYSPDGGASWQVLAVNAAQLDLTLPADLLLAASHPLLLVQASDGVRTTERLYDLATP